MCVQWIRLYLGLYDVTFPDLVVSHFPDATLIGSRMHISPECTSAAVAYSEARFSIGPPGTLQSTLHRATHGIHCLACILRKAISQNSNR